ncbi:hypothetical protein FQN50_001607 [Emmonsiellopsis sp. PD_5]|nr:hypothetical protein FQN50_001607 [Emmonsiellopsis sp. PD_5]
MAPRRLDTEWEQFVHGLKPDGNDLEEAALNVYNSIENVTKFVHGVGDAFASTSTVQFATIFDGRMDPDGQGGQLKPGIEDIAPLA